MILTHAYLVASLRKLDEARVKAGEMVDGKHVAPYCHQPFSSKEGRDGVHGRAYLGIDSETGNIVCCKCREQ